MWKKYRLAKIIEMRPYVPGEDLTGTLLLDLAEFQEGDMIARDPDNPEQQWYMNKSYFLNDMVEVPEGI